MPPQPSVSHKFVTPKHVNEKNANKYKMCGVKNKYYKNVTIILHFLFFKTKEKAYDILKKE